MTYSERAYFEGDHCSHCGEWEKSILDKWRMKQTANALGLRR